jgi:hypothetical protein
MLYSDVIANTARTAAAICPNQMPARLSRMMSLSPRLPGLPPSVEDPPVRADVKRMDGKKARLRRAQVPSS